MTPLLAADDAVAWGQIVTQFGLAGIVLWYVGHVLLPRLLSSAQEERREMIAAFERAMEKQREHDTATATETFRKLDDLAEHQMGSRLELVKLRASIEGRGRSTRGTDGSADPPADTADFALG